MNEIWSKQQRHEILTVWTELLDEAVVDNPLSLYLYMLLCLPQTSYSPELHGVITIDFKRKMQAFEFTLQDSSYFLVLLNCMPFLYTIKTAQHSFEFVNKDQNGHF